MCDAVIRGCVSDINEVFQLLEIKKNKLEDAHHHDGDMIINLSNLLAPTTMIPMFMCLNRRMATSLQALPYFG